MAEIRGLFKFNKQVKMEDTKTKISEITIVLPEKYGISKTSSDALLKDCLEITKNFAKLEFDYDEIINAKENSLELSNQSKSLRNKYVKIRTGYDRAIVSSKEKAQKEVNAHNELRRDVKEEVTKREDALRDKELHFEKIEEAKREKVRQERNTILEKYEAVYGMGDISLMTDDVWRHFINGVKSEFEAKKEAEKKAEAERIAKIEADRIEQERIRKENEQLKKEAEDRERKAEIERKRLLKIEKERKVKEEKERKIREEKQRKEREQFEVKLKKEREEKERIEKVERKKREKLEAELKAKQEDEQKEKDRIAAEEKEKLEEVERLKLLPIKELLKTWIKETEIYDPTNADMTPEVFEKVEEIMIKFNSFKIWANKEIDKLK